ncbi:MAG: protein-L-isoaspartate O-methyltransferase [Alphaproteobacteria bacterium]|nr:protein-L-isoaspartate O-methyltransferase [Alphaproteobacteria bacterium]HCO99925.1 protein-L-isoaspartate O-methyltransferase [Rhodospirillaceae bacterium]
MSTPAHRARQVLALRSAGITDTSALSAIENVPRELFVPDAFRDRAYEDTALPIGYGQTLSQPLVVATMIQGLGLVGREKLLEVGTGSGYHAAILSNLCRRVYTIERHRPLLADAEARFDALGVNNVVTRAGDGMNGWPEQAPFDRISVTAASDTPPQHLLDQLKIGGIMIMPVGGQSRLQQLVRFTRKEEGFESEVLMDVRFVPLLPGVAEAADA